MPEHKWTNKQRMFCREYLIDLNATQACIRAGYSAKTAKQQGSRLLTKVYIEAKIQTLMTQTARRKNQKRKSGKNNN